MKVFLRGLFNKAPKNRIWELDAFRGVCIICVVIIHVVFDMRYFFSMNFTPPQWFNFIQEYGGILFVILSGICITLGHHNIFRGIVVAVCALLVTAATLIVGDPEVYIFFGVLHLLAFCMLTYSLYRKLPWPAILAIGIVFVALGFYFKTLTVEQPYLFPLGLKAESFQAGDFFPIFPNTGYFMIGVVLGKTLYKKKETLFKKVDPHFFLIRFFSFCGRHSLIIYLLQQPVTFGLFYVIQFFKGLGSK